MKHTKVLLRTSVARNFCGITSVKRGQLNGIARQERSFSREEFKRGFAPLKGDIK